MRFQHISVIIPTHNNGQEIRGAIESVVFQDALLANMCTIEMIIVNDASDPEYREQLDTIITEYPTCRLIHLDSQGGPAAARNLGIRHANGDLVSFLDADDEWPRDKLSILLPYFQHEQVEVAGGKIKYIVEENLPDLNLNFEDANQRITHVHLGALIVRRNVFERDLYFDESLRYSEDVDWWIRLRENLIGIVIVEETTLHYHVHGRNMSVGKSLKDLQLLRVFHKSVQRKKEGVRNQRIPQIKDFRIHQKDPLISIILPLYNGKHLVGKCLDSVVRQTYTNWELIIVDDGSTDEGSDYIAEHYANAHIIRKSNGGVAAARNTGINQCKGDIIAFLDQDDEWMPDKLRKQWEVLKANPYCSFVTCNQRLVCYEGVVLPANFSEKLLEEHRGFVPSALLIRKQALLGVNLFDESLEVSSDFDLIRRLRKENYKENNVDSLLLLKWYHGSNASQNKPVLKREILGLLYRQIKGQ